MPEGKKTGIQSNEPVVSISVVSHGQGDLVEGMLASLSRYMPPFLIEVLLTENIPDHPEQSTTLPFPVHVLRNPAPQGFAANHNQAFRHARGEYFAIANPDITFVQEIFRTLINRIEKAEGDIIAPLVVDSDGQIQDSFRVVPKPAELLFRRIRTSNLPNQMDLPNQIRSDWIAGIFQMMRATTFASLGGFDTRYRLYFEDVEFGCRARLAGFRLLVDPSVRIMHDAQRRSHHSLSHFLLHLSSAIRFFTSNTYSQTIRKFPDK